MRTLHTTIALLLVLFNSVFAQVQVSGWKMHPGNEGVVNFKTSTTEERKAAFEQGKKNIPKDSDAGWKPAKTNQDGTVDFSERSVLTQCGQQVDFTYFQTTVNVPANVNMTNFTVSYDEADDGARIYFFNSKHPNGSFSEASDLIGNQKSYKVVDLKDQVVKGENIRIVIVQYDQCPVLNKVKGIRIKVNGEEVAPVVPGKEIALAVLPTKFRLHAYSVNGKRVEKGSNYWMGFKPDEQGDVRIGRILGASAGTVMEFEKEEMDKGKGIVALKVANGPSAGMYLTVQDDNSVKVQKYAPNNSRTQFIVRPPEESSAAGMDFVSFESVFRPGHFLRHQGYVLKLTNATDAERKNVVYRQDASWLFEPFTGAAASNAKSQLLAGESLAAGQKLSSTNGAYSLIMQADGNVVIYASDNKPVWATQTQHKSNGGKFTLQTDGNLVLYKSADNSSLWSSETHAFFDKKFASADMKPVKAVLENDGALVLYSGSNKKVWSSKK